MTGDPATAGVDSLRIMEEIRSRVEEKKKSGFYLKEEIEEISRMELHLREGESDGEETDRLVSWLHSHWEATGPVYQDDTARLSPGREAAKKTLRRFLSPLSRMLLAKQNQINARIVQLLSGALPPLRERVSRFEEREDLLRGIEKENDMLKREVEDLALRLEKLEKESGLSSRGGRQEP